MLSLASLMELAVVPQRVLAIWGKVEWVAKPLRARMILPPLFFWTSSRISRFLASSPRWRRCEGVGSSGRLQISVMVVLVIVFSVLSARDVFFAVT